MKARWQGAVAIAALGAAACVLFGPLIWGALAGEERYLQWDVPEQYWPDLVYLCDALHDGELPLWNPYDRAGYPYHADPQAGTYHPVNWLICAAAGSAPGPGWAQARVVLGFFLAGVFGLLWLRRLHLPWGPALLGAVVIQAAPFMRHNWELNLTTAFAYLPLMLWAADRAVCERRYQDGAVLALTVALCAWVGSPPALWQASLFCGAYAIVRLVETSRGRGMDSYAEGGRALGVGVLLAAGMIAAVVVPALGLVPHSVQAGRDYASIVAGSLEPADLLALVWPLPGNHLYVGLFVLVLAALTLVKPSRWLLPGRWFFLAMALLGVMLALGENGPLFWLFHDGVPGFGVFRLPHRYEAWLGPACGALAAGGLAWLGSPVTGQRLRAKLILLRAVSAGLAVAGTVTGVLGGGWGPGAVLAAAGAIGLLVSWPRFGAQHVLAGVLLGALLLLDVSQALPPDRHTAAGPPPGVDSEDVLALAGATEAEFRYMDEFGISCRSGTRHRRRDLRGYQDPLLLKSLERVWASLRRSPGLAEQYGVRYALTGPHFIHGWNRHFLPPPEELLLVPQAIATGHGVIELPDPLPAAYWIPLYRVERAADRPAALERLRDLAPAPVAILDGTIDGPRDRPDPEGVVRDPVRFVAASDFRLDRDRLSFRVRAPEPGVVVVNEAFYPGWEASVDGQPAPIHRANALVRAIYVDPGEHEVRMAFRPVDGNSLRWVLLVTLIACLVVILGGALSGRGDPDEEAPDGRPPEA